MAEVTYPRVAENCSAPGTSSFSVTSALTAHIRFNAVPGITVGSTFDYHAVAVDGSGVPTGLWEEGIGTYSAANTVARTTVKNGTSGASAVNFSSGNVIVFMTPTAERLGAVKRGGTASQVFTKLSSSEFDADWRSPNIALAPKSANYTLTIDDVGIHHPASDTTGRTMTIPANASVPYPVYTVLTFVNENGAGTLTISITSDVQRLAGSGVTGSRTLAANGVGTWIKVSATEWLCSGPGLT